MGEHRRLDPVSGDPTGRDPAITETEADGAVRMVGVYVTVADADPLAIDGVCGRVPRATGRGEESLTRLRYEPVGEPAGLEVVAEDRVPDLEDHVVEVHLEQPRAERLHG